ncbi:MAG: HAD-superfamily hydrolase, subfamily variant 1 [Anaerocolumna sp.]|jgi:phosphoglycolate phosphatase|nr:HAD-superfamily hydrolase, subfamily variant 1 [Anaerocolumna sp.]
MTYNTIIFDLDGTLLNTLEDLTDSVNYSLETHNLQKRTMDEVKSFVGNGVKRLMDLAVPTGTKDEITAECLTMFREHYSKNMRNKTKPYDEILELLKALKEKGCKLAIVSNKFDSAVKELCKDYYSDYISVAIGDSPNALKKPAPDSVYAALAALNSTQKEALYVGDSDVDVHTAHNAGLKCVGVTWGFRTKELLEHEGADYIIDKPLQLLNYLD